jgi:hypothetical protein
MRPYTQTLDEGGKTCQRQALLLITDIKIPFWVKIIKYGNALVWKLPMEIISMHHQGTLIEGEGSLPLTSLLK